MSYSFTVRGKNKLDVLAKVREQMEGVAKGQPAHVTDQYQVVDAVAAFVKLMPENDAKHIACSVNGSVSKGDSGVTHLGCNISLSQVEASAD